MSALWQHKEQEMKQVVIARPENSSACSEWPAFVVRFSRRPCSLSEQPTSIFTFCSENEIFVGHIAANHVVGDQDPHHQNPQRHRSGPRLQGVVALRMSSKRLEDHVPGLELRFQIGLLFTEVAPVIQDPLVGFLPFQTSSLRSLPGRLSSLAYCLTAATQSQELRTTMQATNPSQERWPLGLLAVTNWYTRRYEQKPMINPQYMLCDLRLN